MKWPLHKGIYICIAMLISFIVAGGVECLADIGASILSDWAASRGKVSVRHDDRGDEMLEWHFEYIKDACYIYKSATPEWKSMKRLSFRIRSDRSAPIFLRLDQSDGRIFLKAFNCPASWTLVDINLSSLQPFGNTSGSFEPSLLKSIYFVDLNGKDNGFTGQRTVYFKDFNLASTSENRNLKKLNLVAFDSKNNVMTIDDFRRNGLSAGQWCFLTGPDGYSVPLEISSSTINVDNSTYSVPQLAFGGSSGTVLHILFWPVGSRYKVWLSADNRGHGMENVREHIFLLNRELAYTRVLQLKLFASMEHAVEIARKADEFKRELDAVSGATLSQQAAEADKILAKMMDYSRQAVMQWAQAKIDAMLAPSLHVRLNPEINKLVQPGQKAIIRLLQPDFRIGFAPSFGFLPIKDQPEKIRSYYDRLIDAGFNHADMPLFWDQMVDQNGNLTGWESIFQFDYLKEKEVTLLAHGLIQTGMPEDIRNLDAAGFSRAAQLHLSRMIDYLWKHYGKSIILWELANEPSSNPWGNMDVAQRLDLLAELCVMFKKKLPEASSMVNDYDWQRGEELSPALKGRITGTLEFYRQLLKKGKGPDVLGIEWYPGVRVRQPQFGVDMAEPCMDILNTYFYWKRILSLGKPVFLTESGFPGTMTPSDRNGYAWGPWDINTQAQAAVDTIKLAMAMDEILGYVWWGITDEEPWNSEGGLFDSSGREKPVFSTLKSFISSLKKPYSTKISSSGTIRVPVMPGKYCVTAGQDTHFIIYRNDKMSYIFKTASCD